MFDCINCSCSMAKTQLWLRRHISYEKWTHMQLLVMVKLIEMALMVTKLKSSNEMISHPGSLSLFAFTVLHALPSCESVCPWKGAFMLYVQSVYVWWFKVDMVTCKAWHLIWSHEHLAGPENFQSSDTAVARWVAHTAWLHVRAAKSC